MAHDPRHVIVDGSADALALVAADGRIEYITAAIEHLSGFRPDELIGRSAFGLVHPGDRERIGDEVVRTLHGPPAAAYVACRLWNKNGSWRPCELVINRVQGDDPAVTALVITYRDTSARAPAEAAVLERAYQRALDELLVGLAHIRLDGVLLRVNRPLGQLLGYAPEELVGLDVTAIAHPDEAAQDLQARRDLLAGAVDQYTGDRRYRRKDGSFVWTSLTVRLHRHSAGDPSHFIAVIDDITERKQSEEERRQAHKMEAVGRLAGGIAHDFNNLLTAIGGYADLALAQLTAEHTLRHDLDEIRKAVQSATSLTRQLLAFSRRQILTPQILDLSASVLHMKSLLRRLIGEQITLEWRLTTPLDRVSADRGQIEQVVLNLALNARDAMPNGGTLAIETANVELDRAYVLDHRGAKPGPHVMLAISDTGVGMDQAVKAHVFEPFYTTKEPGQGTGLGLATVYGIVKQSGGSIFVYSEPDYGTTFKIYLPRVEQQLDMATRPAEPTRALKGSETILLVEDQAEVRAVAREILERHGYTVLDAATGDEALCAARNHDGPIDLLLTDVVMPGMNGRTLAERLSLERPTVGVLYMSGYPNDRVVQQGIAEGSVAFVQKPFTSSGLLAKVRQTLERD